MDYAPAAQHIILISQVLKQGSFVLHPNQFQVNAVWIAFKLNEEPIHIEAEGDFDFLVLMDAASCFIVSSAAVPSSVGQPSKMESKRLLKQGQAQKQQLPKMLFIPTDLPAQHLTLEAERQGIAVVQISEDQLRLFIDETRDGFKDLSGGSNQK